MAAVVASGAGVVPKKAGGGHAQDRPDEKKHLEIIEKADKRIGELRHELDNLRRELDSKQGGRDEFHKAKNDFRGQLDTLTVKINALEAEKKGIEAKLNDNRAKTQELKQGQQRLRKALGFSTVEEIDARIAKLEDDMMVSSYSLKEERKVMQEITQLRQSRPALAKSTAAASSGLASSQDAAASAVPLKTQQSELNKQLDVLYEQRKAIMAKRNKMNADRTASQGPVKELADQRMSIARELQESERTRKEEFDRYRKELREYEHKEQEQRKIGQNRIREEKQRGAVQKKIDDTERSIDNADDFPFETDVTLLQQMKKYIIRLQAEQEESLAPEPKEPVASVPAAPIADIAHGSVAPTVPTDKDGAILPKKAREQFFFAPKVSKSKGKKHAADQKATHHKNKLTFDIDTLSLFSQFDMPAPTNPQDFPACLTKLDAKIADFAQDRIKYEATLVERRSILNKKLADLYKDLASLNTTNPNAEKKEADKASPQADATAA